MKYSEIFKEMRRTKGRKDLVCIANNAENELSDKLLKTGYAGVIIGGVLMLASQTYRIARATYASDKDFYQAVREEMKNRGDSASEKSEE